MPQTEEQVLHQTEAIWRMLDTMSLQNPKQYEQFVANVLKDGESNNMGPPVPEFVVETQKVCVLCFEDVYLGQTFHNKYEQQNLHLCKINLLYKKHFGVIRSPSSFCYSYLHYVLFSY